MRHVKGEHWNSIPLDATDLELQKTPTPEKRNTPPATLLKVLSTQIVLQAFADQDHGNATNPARISINRGLPTTMVLVGICNVFHQFRSARISHGAQLRCACGDKLTGPAAAPPNSDASVVLIHGRAGALRSVKAGGKKILAETSSQRTGSPVRKPSMSPRSATAVQDGRLKAHAKE